MELFSVRLEDADSEPDRTLPRPLSCEPTTESEPDRDLMIDDFSARLEAEPSEALRVKARPRIPEAVRDREPVRDLNSEDLSAKQKGRARGTDRTYATHVI